MRKASIRTLGTLTGLMLLVTLAAPARTASQADASASLLVQTGDGSVRGVAVDGVREFKGIPFAAPPVGALRWEPPAPVVPWTGVLDASQFRSACPQARRFGLTEASDDEDCLHLNVTTPLAGGSRLRAVLVWFYGGQFVGGSTRLYPLDYLAREGDMVVVSVNYRLGPLGFMPHPAFGADFNGGYALEDQRQALRWVQHNIAAFGGDPGNVTIGGVSAGAASVCMHLFTPERTAGLFHRAIIQSAGCTTPLHSVSEASKTGLEVARLVGCGEPATALACLRSKSAHDIVAAATTVAGTDVMTFSPSVGSKALPRQGAEALASGNFVRVPIMNGGNRDEMRLYVGYEVAAGSVITRDTYPDRLHALYGEHAHTVLAAYPGDRYPSAPSALGTVMSDFHPTVGLNNCLFLRTAWLASRWVPVYEYEFADREAPPVMKDPGFEMGAVHTAELPYQFPHFSNTSKLDGPDLAPSSQRLSAQMVAYWSSFARTGRPAARGLPDWLPFKAYHTAMRLKPDELGMFDASAAHQCPMWEHLFPDELSR